MSEQPQDPRPETPMMTCGHAANAQRRNADGTTQPSCAICNCVEVEATALDLTQRRARCAYFGRAIRLEGRGRCECTPCTNAARATQRRVCQCEVPSSRTLPFFAYRGPGTNHYKGEHQFDEFYCGCFGWD